MGAYTCIAPNCPPDCCMCVKAIPPNDEPRQIIHALLTEFAKDGHGARFEDGEHPFVDRARKYLCRPAGASSTETAEEAIGETAIERLGAAIVRALDHAPASKVLSVLTGAFVSLTVELVRREGHDLTMPIKVDGGLNRDITIHAPKSAASSSQRAGAL